MYETLISVAQLQGQLAHPDLCVLDCRFALDDTERGRAAWAEAHIPRAQYAHLDRHLSAEIRPGITGRHPLPERAALAAQFGQWGIGPKTQVVAYDDAGGVFAARCWWLLRWMGHAAVAVLDGGWPAWASTHQARDLAPSRVTAVPFVAGPSRVPAVDAGQVARHSQAGDRLLLDARDPARFRGEVEPIDPVAGHIPGAQCAPFAEHLAEGHFRAAEQLREHYRALLGERAADEVICYCGSGVTAAHTVLAMQHTGLGTPALYPGSWSEWIVDPARPVARG